MIIKIHQVSGRKILAVCDSDLLGKKFTEKDKQLDLSNSFYAGTETKEKDIGPLLRDAYTVNIAGEKSIALFRKLLLISKENIGYINNIPYAFVVLE